MDEDDNGKFRLERVKHQDLQMFGLKFDKINLSYFHPFEAVGENLAQLKLRIVIHTFGRWLNIANKIYKSFVLTGIVMNCTIYKVTTLNICRVLFHRLHPDLILWAIITTSSVKWALNLTTQNQTVSNFPGLNRSEQ